MTENDSYVDALKASLKKKVALLSAIDLENRKQEEILKDPMGDAEAFDATISAKAELVEQITALDEGFEQVYGRMKDILEAEREKYRDDIVMMQEYIRKITDKSVLIQAQEQRNRALAQTKFSAVRSGAKTRRKGEMASGQYYQSMMGLNAYDPQFLDKKK